MVSFTEALPRPYTTTTFNVKSTHNKTSKSGYFMLKHTFLCNNNLYKTSTYYHGIKNSSDNKRKIEHHVIPT